MLRSRKEGGYTLTELMIVIAVIGVLAFPEVEHVRTAAKLTGVQANYRSVITVIYGAKNTDDVATKLTAYFGDSVNPRVEDMTNPITNKVGVATAVEPIAGSTPAVYVLNDTVSGLPSEVEQPNYKGAIVAIVKADNIVIVYGCDQAGKLMAGLQRTIEL